MARRTRDSAITQQMSSTASSTERPLSPEEEEDRLRFVAAGKKVGEAAGAVFRQKLAHRHKKIKVTRKRAATG